MAHQTKWDSLVDELAGHVVQDCIGREGEESEDEVRGFCHSRSVAVITNIRAVALDEFEDDVYEAVTKRAEFIKAQVKARQDARKKPAKVA